METMIMKKNFSYKIQLDPKWVQWFIGFSDAEANFQIFPKKRTDQNNVIKYYNIGYQIRTYSSNSNSSIAIKAVYKYTNLNDLGTISKINKDLKILTGIYAFQNIKTNQIVYLGSSIDLARRFWQHTTGNGSNLLLQRGFKKYGIESFNFLIIEIYTFDLSKSENNNMNILAHIEQRYMDLYQPKYNILKFTRSSKGYKHTEESKIKMSKFQLGKIISEDTKIKISNSKKGISKTEETKNKMSESRKGVPRTEETKALLSTIKSIPVYYYSITEESLIFIDKFESITKASLILKAGKSTITSCIKSEKVFRKNYRLSSIPLIKS